MVDVDPARGAAFRVQHDPQRDQVAVLDVGRGDHAIEVDLVGVLIPEGDDVDDDALGLGPGGLGQHVAHVVVAVREEDDALGAVVREGGHGEADGGGDVGPVAMLHFGQAAFGNEVAAAHGELLDECVAGEVDRPGAILGMLDLLADLLEVPFLHVEQTLYAIAAVHQEEDRELVRGLHVHRLGQAHRDNEDDETAEHDGGRPPQRLQTHQGAQRDPNDQRYQQQQPEPVGLLECDGEDHAGDSVGGWMAAIGYQLTALSS